MPGHSILKTETIPADNPGALIPLSTLDAGGFTNQLVWLNIKNPGPALVTANNKLDVATPSAVEIPIGGPPVKLGPFIYPRTMPVLFCAAGPQGCLVTPTLSMDPPELLQSR